MNEDVQEAQRVKYTITVEATVQGNTDKLRDVLNATVEGAEINIIDIEGVSGVKVRYIGATKMVEMPLDLRDEVPSI